MAPSAIDTGRPVLWHIPVSHYSEKARWALDLKGIPSRRLAPPPGLHIAIALAMTAGRSMTFPVLRLNGRSIGDSTAIIAALEELRPDPPLYPRDAAERRRALDLEDFFDEQLGPSIRLLAWHELRRDPDAMGEVASGMMPAPLRRFGPARTAFRSVGSRYVELRFRVSSESAAEQARETVQMALTRLEDELGDRSYLVGDRFSVADLTAAALLYPLVGPPEGPELPPAPAGFAEFQDSQRRRRAFGWVAEMFERHRRPAPVAAAAPA